MAELSGKGARIWYVRTTGNDTTGDGTLATPYLTVGKAETVAVDGDLVNIGSGTFTAAVASTKALHYQGRAASGTGKTTLTVSSGNTLTPGSWSIIEDLEITNTTASGTALVLTDLYGVIAERCVITSSTGSAVAATHTALAGACRFSSCRFSGAASSVALTGATMSIAILPTVFEDCYFISSATVGGSLLLSEHSWVEAVNCKIIGNATAAHATDCSAVHFTSVNGNWGTARFYNCDFEANSTHASATGLLAAISTGADVSGVAPGVASPLHLFTVQDGTVRLTKHASAVSSRYAMYLRGAAMADTERFNTAGYAMFGKVVPASLNAMR